MFKLFSRQRPAETQPAVARHTNLATALHEGIAKMRAANVDIVVLAQYEAKGDADRYAGHWIDMGKECSYYPFEMLHQDEQQLIYDKKNYKRISLVLENVGEIVKYDGPGVEVAHRTRLNPLLPQMVPESPFYYGTQVGVHTGASLEMFASEAEEEGWTAEAIRQRIDQGIVEYRLETGRMLFGHERLQASLNAIDKGYNMDIHRLFNEKGMKVLPSRAWKGSAYE